jgi:hypothetical protein
MDPVIKALLRGVEKSVELLLDGTFTSVAEKVVAGYIRCLDLETEKRWLQSERNSWKQWETEGNSRETVEKQRETIEKQRETDRNNLEYSIEVGKRERRRGNKKA